MAFTIVIASTHFWVQTVHAKNTYVFLRQERTQCWDPLEPLHSLVAIPFFRQ